MMAVSDFYDELFPPEPEPEPEPMTEEEAREHYRKMSEESLQASYDAWDARDWWEWYR